MSNKIKRNGAQKLFDEDRAKLYAGPKTGLNRIRQIVFGHEGTGHADSDNSVTFAPGKLNEIGQCLTQAETERGELLAALEKFGQVTAPFISEAISSRNPNILAAIDEANAAIKKARGNNSIPKVSA
jgi:hypothetical protein